MSTVQTLAVSLKCYTSAFEKGLRKSQASLSSFASGIGKIGAVAAKSFALIGGAAIAGLSIPVKAALESIDAMGKLSDRLNITTESLAGLKYASDLSGNSFDTLTNGLTKLQKNIGEASIGNKALEESFTTLGLSTEQLKGMDTYEAFKLIADKINELPTSVDRTTLAMQLFGKSGAELLPLIKEGSAGLDAMQKEAEALGLSFSRVEAGQIEAANDAITTLKAGFQGLINSIAIGLAPYIQLAANYFLELGKQGGNSSDWIKDKMTGLVNVIDWAIKGVNLLKGVFYAAAGLTYKSWSIVLKGLSKVLELMAKAADFFGLEGASNFLKTIEEITSESSKALSNMGSDSWDKMGDSFGKAFSDSAVDNIQKRLNENKKEIEDKFSSPALNAGTATTIADAKTKSADKKADALSYNASLIDVKALRTSDPVVKEIQKDTAANKQTAFNTSEIMRQLRNLNIR